jgi:hypothetical protein
VLEGPRCRTRLAGQVGLVLEYSASAIDLASANGQIQRSHLVDCVWAGSQVLGQSHKLAQCEWPCRRAAVVDNIGPRAKVDGRGSVFGQ